MKNKMLVGWKTARSLNLMKLQKHYFIVLIGILILVFNSTYKLNARFYSFYQNFNEIDTLNDSLVYWSMRSNLKFEDFRNIYNLPLTYEVDGGTCYSFIIKTYDSIEGKIIIEIDPIMNKNKSFLGILDSNLLSHEQLHFDIAEVYARKLRYILTKSSRKLNKNNYFKFLSENFSQIEKLCELEQDVYDKQTNHSINKKQQEIWNLKINSDLKKLNKYKSKFVEIYI